MARKPLQWEAFEYYYRDKSSDWFWALWIISCSLALLAVIFHNLLFGIVILIGTFALSVYAKKPPGRARYEINERGVIMKKILYPYVSIDSFGIDVHTPELPKLVLKLKRPFVPPVIILLQGIDEEEVRKFLNGYLPEKNHDEPLSLKVMEYLGF